LPIGFALLNKSGIFVFVNPEFESEYLGYSTGELVGKHYSSITHPDDLIHDKRVRELLLQEGTHKAVITKRYLKKDGTEVWCKVSLQAVFDEKKDFAMFSSFVSALTDPETKKVVESFALKMEFQSKEIAQLRATIEELREERKAAFAFVKKYWIGIVVLLWLVFSNLSGEEIKAVVNTATPGASLIDGAVPKP